MSDSKFDICSKALVLVGANTITSFTESTTESKVASQLYESTLENIKPGISCSEIYSSLSNYLVQENINNGSVGRMGHGLGLQLTEPPSIMQSDQTILEKNMIITLEPSIELSKSTTLVQEENILITEDGYKLLSTRTPEKLPIIY